MCWMQLDILRSWCGTRDHSEYADCCPDASAGLLSRCICTDRAGDADLLGGSG